MRDKKRFPGGAWEPGFIGAWETGFMWDCMGVMGLYGRRSICEWNANNHDADLQIADCPN
jgi:hypothetical protein